jgi:hypothetical protein
MVKPAVTSGKYLINSVSVCLLIVIPVILFITSLDTIKTRDKVWYGGGYDPEYAYLFNSLNIATFRLVGHFDHPGTPMQVYGGFVLRGTWLLNPEGESLTDAVIADPEHYLRILNISTALLASLAFLVFPLFLYYRTKNLWYALILQISPFISGFILFNGFTRITQEAMLMIAALALATSLADRLLHPKTENDRKYSLMFGIISGFGMASKILFAPLMVIPLILLNSNNLRKRFLIAAAVTFVVFTLPVITLYPNMAYWILKLFIFSGQYGTGPVGIVNAGSYPGNLLWIIKASPYFAAVFAIGLVMLTGGLLLKRSRKTFLQPQELRLVAAITTALALGYIIVAKQPKESYLLPYEIVSSVLIVLILYKTVNLQFFKNRRGGLIVAGIIILSLVFFMIPQGISLKQKLYSSDKNHLWETSYRAAASAPGVNAVVFTHPGSSLVSALFFGNAYSHWRYAGKLRELHPDSYILNLAEGYVCDWDNQKVGLSDLYKKYGGKLLVYGPAEAEEAMRKIMATDNISSQSEIYYRDEKQLILAALMLEDSMVSERKLIFSSAEAIQGNPDFAAPAHGISRTGEISFEKKRSGNSSIMTNAHSPYAFTTVPVMLKSGDGLTATVWVLGPDHKTHLAVAEAGSRKVLSSVTSTGKSGKEWEKITLYFTAESTISEIIAYTYNEINQTAWFDDFSVEIVWKNNVKTEK